MGLNNVDQGLAWVVLLGVNLINISTLPLVQCFGIIFQEKFAQIGMTAGEISFILHFNSFILCCLGFIIAPIFRIYSFKNIGICGSILAIISICSISIATEFWMLVVTYCLMLGVAQGVLFSTTNLAISTYFVKKRSIAMGITITASGLGTTITPYLCTKLLENFALRGTILILGGVSMHSLIGALLLRDPSRKSQNTSQNSVKQPENVNLLEKEIPSHKIFRSVNNLSSIKNKEVPLIKSENNLVNLCSASDPTLPGIKSETLLVRLTNLLNLELLRDPIFLNIMIGMSFSFVAELNFNLMIPFVLAELAKFDKNQIAMAMTIQGSVDILSRFIVPFFATRFQWDARGLYVFSLFGSIIARTVISVFSSQSTVILSVAALVGMMKGIKAVFQSIIIPNYVSIEKLPSASGLVYIGNGILSLLMGPVIGIIHDIAQSYIPALHTTSALSFTCILLWFIEYLSTKQRKHFEKSSKDDVA